MPKVRSVQIPINKVPFVVSWLRSKYIARPLEMRKNHVPTRLHDVTSTSRARSSVNTMEFLESLALIYRNDALGEVQFVASKTVQTELVKPI